MRRAILFACLLLSVFFLVVSVANAAPGTVSGTITDGVNPVEGVWVEAYGGTCWDNWLNGTSTDASGSYTITGLPGGTDVYVRACPTCNGQGFVDQWFESGSDCDNSTPVPVTDGGDTPNIDFALAPAGSISGKVVDEEGKPIAGVHVSAQDGPWGNWLAGSQTEADGSYFIAGVPVGDVYVRACAACNGLSYLNTWYDAPNWADDPNLSTVLTISQEVTAQDIDFALRRGPGVINFLNFAVYNGELELGFGLLPWAEDFLQSAVISLPNGSRVDYTYDLVADKLLWDSECRPLYGYWYHGFGAVQAADYGSYTLTLTFKGGEQQIFTGTLAERTIVGAVDDTSLTVAVQNDGGLVVNWTADGTPGSNQTWQVRVKEGSSGSGREVYKSGSKPYDTRAMTIPVSDLGCLARGGQYRILVRAWSFDSARAETVEKAFTYNPSSLVDRYAWKEVTNAEGNLAIGFDVRPGSRANVVSASVSWPGDSYTYNFDLTKDWYDISTKSRFNKGWWVKDPNFPKTDGDYTFTIHYADGYTDTVSSTFADSSVTPVDETTMGATVNADGSVDFMWDLPEGAAGQKYQVRIADKNYSREYFSSDQKVDMDHVQASAWDLRALPPGRFYKWVVRAWDASHVMREQSTGWFFYDPFKIGGPDMLSYFQTWVNEGDVNIDFSLLPAYRDMLEEAYVEIPNAGRTGEFPRVPIDLAADRFIWDSVCRPVDLWTKDLGPVQAGDYGRYKLILLFKNGWVKSYDADLVEEPVVGADSVSSVTVNSDGSVQVDWTATNPDPNQTFQIRIKQLDTGKELYKGPNLPSTDRSYVIPAEDLRCLKIGETYNWRIRSYSENGMAAVNVDIASPVAYDPDDANRISDTYLADHNGRLAVQFRVSPADRDSVLSASVSGPGGFSYDYDIVKDQFDMSTETRRDMTGWFATRPDWSAITDGTYTFTVAFDRDGDGTADETDTIQRDLTVSDLTPVDSATMGQQVYQDGSIHFWWQLPSGITGQYYQVGIRNADQSLEFFRSSTDQDSTEAWVNQNQTGTLVPGRTYVWFVRAYDAGSPYSSSTMRQSQVVPFVYSPFGVEREDPVSGTFLYDNFSDPFINPEKWNYLETVRRVKNGVLESKLRTDSNWERNLAQLPEGQTVNSIKSDVRILDINRASDANSVYARVGGRFYNVNASPGDDTGDVYAGIKIGDRGNGLEVWWSISEKVGASEDYWNPADVGALAIPGGVLLDTAYQLEVVYNGGNSFTFTIYDASGVQIDSASGTGPAPQGMPLQKFNGLATCAGQSGESPGLVFIDAEFDNVMVNGNPYDNFDGQDTINSGSWASQEIVREVTDWGTLALLAHSEGGQRRDATMVFPQLPDYIQADFTVHQEGWITPGATGRARISGYFYNDTYDEGSYVGLIGNIWAQVYIDRYDNDYLEAKAYVERVTDEGHTTGATLFSHTFMIPVNYEHPYQLAIQKTGDALVFRVREVETGEQEQVQMPITGSQFPAADPYRAIRSRVYGNGTDSSGRMFIEVDNVMVDQPPFQLTGVVYNHRKADGSFATHLEVDPGQDFLAPLPEGIETLRIEGPNGLLLTKEDLTYDAQFRTFYTQLPGSPDLGEYAFTATNGTQVQHSSDLQLFNRALPIPNLVSPAPGAALSSKTPSFSWEQVEDTFGTRLYYRLEIIDAVSDSRVYASSRMQDATEASVPAWALAPGGSYKWRVRVTDSGEWTGIQNRVQSDWRSFTTAATLNHSSTPVFDPANWYAATYETADGPHLLLQATVTDADGVAVDGSSHFVTVTLPDFSVVTLDFYGTMSANSGEWLLTIPGNAQAGDYVFEVTDPDGLSSTLTDSLTVNPLPVPDESSITPNNRAESITATFDNVVVNGALYDNFDAYGSANDLDPGKWSGWGPDTGVAISGQKLLMSAGGTVGRGDATLAFADPASINSIAADVTITAASSDDLPRARIYGYFFSNGQADVAAQIVVRKDGVYYSVQEEYWDDALYWIPLHEGVLRTDVAIGNAVTVSINFDGSAITFDAGDGNTHTYTPTGTILPPEHSEKQLKVRTNFVVPVEPTFTWSQVPGAARYRLRIYDTYNNKTIHKGYVDDGATTTYTVPAGVLDYDHMYRFRLQAWDAVAPGDVDNASKTPAENGMNYVFYTEPFPGLDSDGDGVIDEQDAFPFDPNETVDTDGDGVGDNADAFPADPSEWVDTDGDGTGNNADLDDDADGMPDAYEVEHGLNPLVDDAALDRDEDGVSNIDEMNAGTDPSVPDYPALIVPGDVNGDTVVNLTDGVIALQLAAGLPVDPANVHDDADVDGDGKIGLAEALYVLQYTAGVRSSAVSTVRDERGIWYIAGSDNADLFTVYEAMGYAVATDRLWQAETYRRSARGTLAEVFGRGTNDGYLNQDVLVRTTGYTEQELTDGYNALDTEAKAMIDGYVAGFNRRIAEVNADPAILPYEFKVTGVMPVAPWTAQDVLAWTALMLRNFDPEAMEQGQIDNAELFQQLSMAFPNDGNGNLVPDYFDMFNDLRWGNDPDALTYIADGAAPASTGYSPLSVPETPTLDAGLPDFGIAADNLRQMRQSAEESLKEINVQVKMGSYAWVVDGNKTASGNPIIYSGPQMGFSTPAITMEGAIFAGGVNISGMTVAGIPGIIIGRTPHHAWSMQVGHAHTVDYYFEAPGDVALDRWETFNIAGEGSIDIPVWKTSHGPVVNPIPYVPATYNEANDGPIVAWKYSHVGREFGTIEAFLDLARAKSMDEFGAAIENVAVSQHFCYADKDGNIAHWMSGYDPNRLTGPGYEYRLPQGIAPAFFNVAEWQDGRKDLATVRNPTKHYIGGWNNKASADYESSYNNLSYFFGPFHRAHVLDEYLSSHDNLTFDDVRNIALYIASTDSFGGGGNPWEFVANEFAAAVTGAADAAAHPERQAALNLVAGWDGHFVAGGPTQWAFGPDRADAWMLMDAWIREVLRLTFEDELSPETYNRQNTTVLFNVLLHGLDNGTALTNAYDWFANDAVAGAPQTANDIIVAALDTVLENLGPLPWGIGQRGEIQFRHDVIAGIYAQAPYPQLNPVVHTMPFSSRSTFAHCVEYDGTGPVRIESMFALGQSGDIRTGAELTPGVFAPVYDPNFKSMTDVFDGFGHRPFPLNP